MAFRHPSSGEFTFDTETGADSDEFLYTDPLATDATLPQPANTPRRWCHDTDDTTSVDIGPTSGAGGSPDGYLYTEASSPAAAADDFYLEFDTTLDVSNVDLTVEFKTNQRGNNNEATVWVETNENGAGWVSRAAQGSFGGASDPDKVNTAGSQIWTQRSVSLKGVISHASTRIRLHITLGSTGSIWHNDYGIDEVVFIGADPIDREQDKFRYYDDDGDEDASTALENQDTDLTRGKTDPFQLRIGTQLVGDPPTEACELQYKENGDAAAEWRKLL